MDEIELQRTKGLWPQKPSADKFVEFNNLNELTRNLALKFDTYHYVVGINALFFVLSALKYFPVIVKRFGFYLKIFIENLSNLWSSLIIFLIIMYGYSLYFNFGFGDKSENF